MSGVRRGAEVVLRLERQGRGALLVSMIVGLEGFGPKFWQKFSEGEVLDGV